ncbi:unnamed protein product [Kuraishia capsulata CBS 1993]|uniref:N-acetyltransferase domain-containing protein n=1 Tax=Kuraishia capsulata CBS 1993 TaxID=1382522 RepID=W6MI36_9ASCO|nr:uncharacterized protein KUCA_T00001483001 [Kuraishia capsulata CBS 1993]CDK25513.1 unnamed protein product [Kuraishia capsulata CBS 1993]
MALSPKKLDLKGLPATIYPFQTADEIPEKLKEVLFKTFNDELERGDTYPQEFPASYEEFDAYWLHYFVAVMLEGNLSVEELGKVDSFEDIFLGSYYIKPNYPGRSSHNCNAGFLVNFAKRGRSIGKTLGQSYLEWAPKLGYTYSVFNLVYETNVASCKIWDGLGFDRIGKVKNAGRLKGYDHPVAAILFGKDLV